MKSFSLIEKTATVISHFLYFTCLIFSFKIVTLKKEKVMKDLVKITKSFITFDFPLQTANISTQFANTHRKLQTENAGWSTTATRQKLISYYWFTYVAAHFSIMFGLPVIMVFLIQGFEKSTFYLISILIAGLLSYPILYLFHYRPYFSSIFLPRLETIKETYDRKQIEQLEKCRQAQLSNFALALVFYVFDKTTGMNTLQCNDRSAELLPPKGHNCA